MVLVLRIRCIFLSKVNDFRIGALEIKNMIIIFTIYYNYIVIFINTILTIISPRFLKLLLSPAVSTNWKGEKTFVRFPCKLYGHGQHYI